MFLSIGPFSDVYVLVACFQMLHDIYSLKKTYLKLILHSRCRKGGIADKLFFPP